MNLELPTPAAFPAFPYSPPYNIQNDLMRHLYDSIERRKVTIVESPTGTVRSSPPMPHIFQLMYSVGENSESTVCVANVAR